VKKNVAAHADADGTAAWDAEVIQQSQSVQRALAVRDGSLRICGPAVTLGVRRDEFVFAEEWIAPRIGPILVGAAATVQEQERLAVARYLIEEVDPVD